MMTTLYSCVQSSTSPLPQEHQISNTRYPPATSHNTSFSNGSNGSVVLPPSPPSNGSVVLSPSHPSNGSVVLSPSTPSNGSIILSPSPPSNGSVVQSPPHSNGSVVLPPSSHSNGSIVLPPSHNGSVVPLPTTAIEAMSHNLSHSRTMQLQYGRTETDV